MEERGLSNCSKMLESNILTGAGAPADDVRTSPARLLRGLGNHFAGLPAQVRAPSPPLKQLAPKPTCEPRAGVGGHRAGSRSDVSSMRFPGLTPVADGFPRADLSDVADVTHMADMEDAADMARRMAATPPPSA